MGKGTKLYSIFFNTCPRCQQGSFFAVSNPYNLKRFDEMNPQCACCGERFEREPGYYTGALYVSYAYYTALIVGCFIVMEVLLAMELGYFLAILISLIILLTPVVFRLARLTWINFFISYDAHKPTHCP
ncbi:DUF983 domain-containing protein [Spirosoma utsteinense]|uniref:DUF983 domain-containing protein n=1 Tax=Spirosoma utsteinense TaxID=2585773 RepID=A0ABR6W7T1_9BACT|nr:DUF983 domain-containing protein [Spirosoma utsteinense]MBC3789044.1 putative protein (DUF983 family) [Spirosoma utsteinense]MBC3792629.1 putative protein (DUF983 family) [Spirosoma utsteinense]